MDQDTDMFTGRPMRDEYLEQIANQRQRPRSNGDPVFALVAGLFRLLPRHIQGFIIVVFMLVAAWMFVGPTILAAIHR